MPPNPPPRMRMRATVVLPTAWMRSGRRAFQRERARRSRKRFRLLRHCRGAGMERRRAMNGTLSPAIESWNTELAFRSVVEATADKAGLEFLRHLVKNLAESLGVAYTFVAEFAGAADRVRTIAFWDGKDWRPNVEFPLGGTPCEQVVAGELCIYRDDVQRLFPADSDLVTLGA